MVRTPSQKSFPDKERDPSAQGAFGLLNNAIPTTKMGGQVLARRLKSLSGYSRGSSEDGPPTFRHMTSFGSATDSCRSIKFAVRTPGSESRRERDPFYTHETLMEMTREAHNEDTWERIRPPSPRPNTPRQRFVEHNKQLHVWDDWVTLNSARDSDYAAIMSERSPSKGASRSFRRIMEGQDTLEDIDPLDE